MLDSLMQNAVIWLILSLCTIGSMVWGVYTWLTSKRCKEISYEFETTEVIKAGKCFSDKLDIRFAGKTISNLSVTKFYIWNSGTEIINGDDVVSSKPLSIRGNKRTLILEAEIAYLNETTNEFRVETLSNEALLLSFDYVAKRQGIVLQVLHTGRAEELVVDCTIKGGEKVKNPSNQAQLSKYQKLLRALLPAYQSISAYIGIFLAVPIVEKIETLEWTQISKVVFAISIMSVLALISILFSRRLRKTIRNRNPHIVPPALKKTYISIPIKTNKNIRYSIHAHEHTRRKTGV